MRAPETAPTGAPEPRRSLGRPLPVSIVIVARDHQESIERCLESAVDQRPAVSEILVIDDASTDYTVDKVIPWLVRDRRIRAFWIDRRVGRERSMDVGSRLAQCPALVHLDGDEVLRTEAIGAALQHHRRHRRASRDEPVRALVPTAVRSLHDPIERVGFGGVVMCPGARYHVDELAPLAGALRRRGHSVSFLVPPQQFEPIVLEMARYDLPVFAWPDEPVLIPEFSAVVMLNDWAPMTRSLVQLAAARDVPTFAKVEGVQDFQDLDTGRLRYAYRRADYVLCQGRNDVDALPGCRTHIVGNTRLERIMFDRARVFDDPPWAVVNSNFTYSVLTDERQGWLESVRAGCAAAGVEPVISQHHADPALGPGFRVDRRPMRHLLMSAHVLISRFSTVPFEAMARGVPFVYFNPHGERVPTFASPNGAFEVAMGTSDLTAAIGHALATRGRYRDVARRFFDRQVSIEPGRPSEERAAEFIDAMIQRWRP